MIIMLQWYDTPEVMVDARFLHHWMVGYPDNEHNSHIDGYNPDHGIISARPDVIWPIISCWFLNSCQLNILFLDPYVLSFNPMYDTM